MNTRTKVVVGVAALLFATLVVSTQVLSQDKPGQQPPAGEWGDAMAEWAKLNAKGPEHERFKEMVGTWETESKFWIMPGTEPMLSKGTAVFELLFDGRYIQQEFRCDMQGAGFVGRGIEGYDTVKKKYVSIWLDSMCTGIMMSEGTADAAGNVIYYGTMNDPMTGTHDVMTRTVARCVNPDKAVFEMYETRPGLGEFKSMEITYTRKK